jgi:hypothetical protein
LWRVMAEDQSSRREKYNQANKQTTYVQPVTTIVLVHSNRNPENGRKT